MDARPVFVPAGIVRGLLGRHSSCVCSPPSRGGLIWPGRFPLMSTERARAELGWTPRYDSKDALRELIAGMRAGADGPTPPLSRATSGPLRVHEFLTGLGQRP